MGRLRLQKQMTSERSKIFFCYLMPLPILALFFILRVIPIAKTFWMSLFDWKLIGSGRPFIGLENYHGLLFDDQFWVSIKNTFLYAGIQRNTLFVDFNSDCSSFSQKDETDLVLPSYLFLTVYYSDGANVGCLEVDLRSEIWNSELSFVLYWN